MSISDVYCLLVHIFIEPRYLIGRWLDRYWGTFGQALQRHCRAQQYRRPAPVGDEQHQWNRYCQDRWLAGLFEPPGAATLPSHGNYGFVSYLLWLWRIHSREWSFPRNCLQVQRLQLSFFFQWYYYVNRRDRPQEWKCQPEKFLSPEVELHEIFVGGFSMLIMSCLSGILSCYAMNNGRLLTLYYRWDEYGWWWFFGQILVIFLYQVSLFQRQWRTYIKKKNFLITGLSNVLASQNLSLAVSIQTLS